MQLRALVPLASLVVTACVDSTIDARDESTDVGDQEAGGIFAGDPPGDSCALGVPLACASTLWSVTYATNQLTGATTTQTFRRNNVAGFTAGAGNNTCTSTIDFIANDVLSWHGSRSLPAGFSYRITDDRKSIQFINANGDPAEIANGLSTLCGMSCDSTGARLHQANGDLCRPNPTDEEGHQVATVTGGGGTRQVRMAGEVGRVDLNTRTGQITLYCKMTLDKNAMTSTVDKRPNDVIATLNDRFVRGYEYKNSQLTNACSAFANLRCANRPGECVLVERDACVANFSQPDPCASSDNPFPR